FRILRPPLPETLRLRPNSIGYDSGLPPFDIKRKPSNQSELWRAMYPERTVIDIDRKSLDTLRLRETDSGNRLTLDVGAKRIDMVAAAGEVSREWLFRVLNDHYRLNRDTSTSFERL